MKERPILFSGPMGRIILDGRRLRLQESAQSVLEAPRINWRL